MTNDTGETTVRISGADWLKIVGILATFVVSIAGAAITAHLSYEKRFTRLETRQEQIITVQTKLVDSQSMIGEMKALLSIVNDRQKEIERKLDRSHGE